MVSDETGLPERFDPATGENVKWSAPLGTECYASPVVAGGRVFIGTNNDEPRDPRHRGDRGVLMCLDEADGSLAWQLVVPKLEGDVYLDWPRAGICSPVTVEGDRVYTVTNRDEVVCLDVHGLANGNDGPFRDEGRHMTPQGEPVMEPGPLDADILWLLDLRSAAGVRPHDSAHASILLDGPFLYANTSNGLVAAHDRVDRPEAPSLVAIDKATGRLLAREREGIGPRTFHGTWSSPALGEVAGRRLVFFGGGDGVVHAFEALRPGGDIPDTLRRVWRFDCDPTAPKEDVHRYIRNRRESPSTIQSMPVFCDGRVYVTAGGDIWWGKRKAWLMCIDAAGEGDLTARGPVWSYPLEEHCCSTPAVRDGLVYAADCGGKVHCVDAQTGKPHWVHDAGREIWASTLVADGKVYVGTRRGDLWVLAAGKEKRVLSSIRLDDPIIGTCTVANGTLYVATMKTLYALGRTEPASETTGSTPSP
ncbi:MAG: PQQ-binding-like beta-propeller repeat protein [Pirellulales bacterium]|nr:PQQ-binding-like beta-propeller repeat protein [Pirellulales bacterium]